MEFYRLTIPIPKKPWQWVRYRITTIFLLVAIIALAIAWWRDHRYLAGEIYRIKGPGPRYEAAQATGPPDVPRQGDSPYAWCPATMDGGAEWLLLDFQQAVTPAAIVVHENYAPGAIVRITHFPVVGKEETLWEGMYKPTAGTAGSVAHLPVSVAIQTSRIKLYLDTAAAAGWNEIDAVGLIDAIGETIWASGATASSTWASPSNLSGVNVSRWSTTDVISPPASPLSPD
jgi:hypothetical protein